MSGPSLPVSRSANHFRRNRPGQTPHPGRSVPSAGPSQGRTSTNIPFRQRVPGAISVSQRLVPQYGEQAQILES